MEANCHCPLNDSRIAVGAFSSLWNAETSILSSVKEEGGLLLVSDDALVPVWFMDEFEAARLPNEAMTFFFFFLVSATSGVNYTTRDTVTFAGGIFVVRSTTTLSGCAPFTLIGQSWLLQWFFGMVRSRHKPPTYTQTPNTITGIGTVTMAR